MGAIALSIINRNPVNKMRAVINTLLAFGSGQQRLLSAVRKKKPGPKEMWNAWGQVPNKDSGSLGAAQLFCQVLNSFITSSHCQGSFGVGLFLTWICPINSVSLWPHYLVGETLKTSSHVAHALPTPDEPQCWHLFSLCSQSQPWHRLVQNFQLHYIKYN